MVKKVKLTRKEIKSPDEFINTWTTILIWVQDHKNPLLIALGCIVGVSLIIAGATSYLGYQENQALNALSGVKNTIEPASSDDPAEKAPQITADQYLQASAKYQEVFKKYSVTKAGKLALLYAAENYFKAGKYDQASESYQKFIANFNENQYLKTLAFEGLGYSYEALGEFAKAAEQFEKAADPGQQIIRPFGLLNAARNYELANNPEKSIELYEKFIEDFPESSLQASATANLTRLKGERG